MRRVAPLLAAALFAHADEEPLKLEGAVPLEGVRGRIDHMALAPDGNRLVVAALGNDTVEIVDLKEKKVVHRIRDIGAPTAAAFVGGHLEVAAARDGKLHLFDGTSYERRHSVDVGADADPLRVDAEWRCTWVGAGEGSLVAVEKGAKWFEIPLAGHPEGFQLETKGPRIFVNVPDRAMVVVADRERRKVAVTWQVEEAKDNYPMALDEKSGRVLVGCRTPPKLLALDMKDGTVKASLGISGDVDDLYLDPKSRLLYASCGEGFMDVVDADRFECVARVPTGKGARTCLLDAGSGRLFVAVPMHEGKPAEIRVYRTAPAPPRD